MKSSSSNAKASRSACGSRLEAVATYGLDRCLRRVPVRPSTVLADENPEEEALVLVKSPMVGTFYGAPEPGADAFVEVGSTVQKGQVLCIIEAMKLMNEIDAEHDGEIASVFAENGQPVQYGEKLFAIKPA